MFQLEPILVNELYAQALDFESRQTMLHETYQQFMTSANSAMRGCALLENQSIATDPTTM
jgi:hypothetical protein